VKDFNVVIFIFLIRKNEKILKISAEQGKAKIAEHF